MHAAHAMSSACRAALDRVRIGSALVVGAALIALPYVVSRGLANRQPSLSGWTKMSPRPARSTVTLGSSAFSETSAHGSPKANVG